MENKNYMVTLPTGGRIEFKGETVSYGTNLEIESIMYKNNESGYEIELKSGNSYLVELPEKEKELFILECIEFDYDTAILYLYFDEVVITSKEIEGCKFEEYTLKPLEKFKLEFKELMVNATLKSLKEHCINTLYTVDGVSLKDLDYFYAVFIGKNNGILEGLKDESNYSVLKPYKVDINYPNNVIDLYNANVLRFSTLEKAEHFCETIKKLK